MASTQADGVLPSPPENGSNSVANCVGLGLKRRRSVPSLTAEEARRAVPDDDETRLDKMQKACTTLLECLGEDVSREGLVKTPKRMAEALLACTRGYSQSVEDIVNEAVFEEDHHEMILVKDIEIHSLCEHHMVPFTGKSLSCERKGTTSRPSYSHATELFSIGMDGHKVKSHPAPESRVGEEGTSKRNITRKGSAKGKNGGGGGQKGRWDPTDDGSEAKAVDGIADKGDPNYDSEADEHDNNYVLVSDSTVITPNGVPGPLHTLPEFKRRLKTIIEEYFLSEDAGEVLRSVRELKSPAYHYEIVKRGINMSLDARDHERELVSKLLSDAYPDVLSSREVCKGFERLFEMIDDIQLDAPNARTLVASFLARAVADEIIPPSVLRNAAFLSLGGEVVKGARRLLSRDHVLSRLEHVWGPGDGRPVEDLKVAIDQLLVEFLLSRQLDEAAACVKELDCSLFHHEIVKRAVKTALDRTDDDRTSMSSLLVYLNNNEVISDGQMKKGFDRLHEILPDLILDTPSAPSLLEKFTEQAISDGCLPADYTRPSPPAAEDASHESNGVVPPPPAGEGTNGASV